MTFPANICTSAGKCVIQEAILNINSKVMINMDFVISNVNNIVVCINCLETLPVDTVPTTLVCNVMNCWTVGKHETLGKTIIIKIEYSVIHRRVTSGINIDPHVPGQVDKDRGGQPRLPDREQRQRWTTYCARAGLGCLLTTPGHNRCIAAGSSLELITSLLPLL